MIPPIALSDEEIARLTTADAVKLTDEEMAMLDAEFAALLNAVPITDAESKRQAQS